VVGDAVKGSTGEIFSKFNIPAFLIDIGGIEKGNAAAAAFMTKKIPSRTIGAGFNTNKESWFYEKESLYARFDGLIFINEVTAATGLQ